VQPTGRADDLQGCDLIIASVFEKRDVKAQATKEAEARLAPGGFIGIHFFSPVDRMPLVEIIKGRETSPQTLARAVDFVQQLRKTPIVVNDSRGFFTSRVFGTFTKEGAAMLTEGIVAARIDNAALAVGMPVGPLAVMDETSMALTWSVRQQTIADLTPLPPAAASRSANTRVVIGWQGGFADSAVLRHYAPAMLKGRYSGSTLNAVKDMDIALDLGRETGTPLPLAGVLAAARRCNLMQPALRAPPQHHVRSRADRGQQQHQQRKAAGIRVRHPPDGPAGECTQQLLRDAGHAGRGAG
jgi:3-hydroxyacyl-CoA dehydrogenase